MKVTDPAFLLAKKDKDLSAFIVIQSEKEGSIMRLCVDAKVKYTDKRETVFIECPTEIKLDSYHKSPSTISVTRISFHNFVWQRDNPTSHIVTFLHEIKKDSDVSFRVVGWNQSDFDNKRNLTHHQLYGIIGNKQYFLADYCGADNTASPIQYTIK